MINAISEKADNTEKLVEIESLIEKIRLANKLKELNINSWEITTTSFFNYSSRNKEGNFIKAFYKGNEILF